MKKIPKSQCQYCNRIADVEELVLYVDRLSTLWYVCGECFAILDI